MNAAHTNVGLRTFLFIIVALLFAEGLTSSVCNAAVALPEVRVGSELDFPPYAFIDQNGQVVGFSVELIKAVADAMGLSIKISTGSWDAVWNALAVGQIDVLPIVAKLPERQLLVDFSLPHTETYDAFFVRKGTAPIRNINAARGKEIVVMRSDAAHHELVERNFQGNLILVDTIPAGLLLVASGKHDAFLCSKLIGVLSIESHGVTGLSAGPIIPDYNRVFSFAVKKGGKELLEKLNQGLLIVKTNGEYDRIYDKWLSFDDPWRKTRKYFLPATITVIALALIAGFWLAMLRRLVDKRTRELAEKNEMLSHAYDNLEVRVQERTAELAQANQLLQENEERLAFVLEGSQLGYWDWNLETNEVKRNERWAEMLGYKLQDIEFTVKQWIDFVHPDDQAAAERSIQDHIEGRTAMHKLEYRMRARDGQYRWILDQAKVVEYALDGRPIRMSGTHTDITDRKKAEEKLRNSEALWRLSIDHMLEGYALHEAIFDENGRMADYRFLEFNPAAQKISNIAREDIVGRTAMELYPHIVERGLMDRYADVMATGVSAVIDDFYYTGDKLDKAFDISCFRIDDCHFVCVFRDITARKQAEEKIKASLLEKETMLREIHHRVKNNLQVISSLLNLQSSYLQDPQAREMIKNSRDRVKVMANIHTMLYQSADLAKVDFGRFIRDLAGHLQQSFGLAAASPIQIHVDAEDASLNIETSIPCGLILNELVSNAMKHAFPEGKGGEIKISMKAAGDGFVLTVQDNGIGFSKVGDFRKKQSLGLELVSLLAEQINGKIDMQVDGGTTWTIAFSGKKERSRQNG